MPYNFNLLVIITLKRGVFWFFGGLFVLYYNVESSLVKGIIDCKTFGLFHLTDGIFGFYLVVLFLLFISSDD